MLLQQFLQAVQDSANDKWQHQDYCKSDALPGRIRMILSYGVPCGKPVIVKPLSTEESTNAASAALFDAVRQYGASPNKNLPAESVENVLTDRIDILKHILNQQKLKYRDASIEITAESETADLMRFLVYKGDLTRAKRIATGSPKLEHLYQEIARQECIGKVSW